VLREVSRNGNDAKLRTLSARILSDQGADRRRVVSKASAAFKELLELA